MKIVFDFTVVEHVRPSDSEACLFILKGENPVVLMGYYYEDGDYFDVDDMNRYDADDVLYWVNNSL
jgi:hypothetical protein